MAKVLLIVESPAKVKTIKKYLPKDNEYFVLASVGHVVDLSNKYKHRLGINLDNKYAPHFVINKDKINVMQSILDVSTIVDKIILCTDPDREGEAIAYHLEQRLLPLKKEIKRAVFYTLDAPGIKKGLKEERDVDYNLVDAAIARRALDRIVGFIGSPFVISKIGRGSSAGRVQSVALKLVVDREKEIESFKPEEYWNVKVELFKFAKTSFMTSLYHKNVIGSKEEAYSIKKELENSSYVVKKVVAKPKNRYPYAPLNTAKLQMIASSKLNIPASRTVIAAQELYQEGRVTYIRTDSVRLSPEAIDMARKWIRKEYSNCLPDKPNLYKNKDSAQDAHEAIRPTDINDKPKKDPKTDEDKIYKSIWEYYVASQMKPAVYDTTSVTIETNKKRILKTNGRVLKEAGWLSLLGIEEDDDNEKDNMLPILIVKDILNLGKKGVVVEQKFTQPPSRYKEHTLVKELESRGIGRPSTYATIMKTICETRNFIDKKNNSLFPTKLGIDIVELLSKYFTFMNFDYTSKLETKLDLISYGKCTYFETMDEFFIEFKKEVDKAYKETIVKTGYTCNKCNSEMILKKSMMGYFLGCSNYPECKGLMSCDVIDNKIVLIPEKNKHYVPDNIKCPICGSKMTVRVGKFGKFYSCCNYPECKGSSKIPYGKKCPKCNNELYRNIFRQGPVLCCMGYPKCKYIEKINEASVKSVQKEMLENSKNS